MYKSPATITTHTTASSPRPHILYIVDVTHADGSISQVARRYSEFVELHTTLADKESLPPKRTLVTSFIPSAWADDRPIAERKAGLASYLASLLRSEQNRNHPALLAFLSASTIDGAAKLDLEDALPSTLSRKAALQAQQVLKAQATQCSAAAYYPDWANDTNPPQDLDFSKFNILLFAFATPNSSSTLDWDSGATSTLQTLVSSAHNSGYGTKVVISIGRLDGSYWFSQAVGSSANITTFVNACISAVITYDLDGIDIDWEYPGETGAGNLYSPSDAANLLTFFTALRNALGSSKIISAAVTDLPWTGSNGSPLTDVSAYAKVMTYANIMNYDVFGASSTAPGPNAPLGNLCNNSSLPQYSAEAAVSQWTGAELPASQLVLGLPLYGYVSESTKTSLTDFVELEGFDRERERAARGMSCPLPRERGAVQSKTKQENKDEDAPNALNGAHPRKRVPVNVAQDAASGGVFVAENGYTEGWDNCSDTPFLFDTARTTVVAYDDTYSLGDKASYAKSAGLAGCFTWSLDQIFRITIMSCKMSYGLVWACCERETRIRRGADEKGR
ncbi:glycoside hydrolase family 18 protein [Wolfiporia cocos MD-104 SS10]|uniref:Glycoside hydrolase family 18 protein n=1 Tax=Wolfiporia cocos (strain MD-104) TaxID=742152 RepID=A0A2H3JES4_WOLCO|nr:glycoside hydrolase family 18 protein [Wolfiporia cocos MD-104 SS10]